MVKKEKKKYKMRETKYKMPPDKKINQILNKSLGFKRAKKLFLKDTSAKDIGNIDIGNIRGWFNKQCRKLNKPYLARVRDDKMTVYMIVDNVLEKLTKEFIQNPMRFFSEADIHWYFCHLLLKEKSFDKLTQTNFKKFKYKTSLLHQEYGLKPGKGERIDIAILDAKDVKRINKYSLKCDKNYIKPFIGIEFLTEKNYSGSKGPGKIEKVYNKLKERDNAISHAYLVLYYRRKSKRGRQFVKNIKDKIKELYKNDNGKVRFFCVIRNLYEESYEELENGEWKMGVI